MFPAVTAVRKGNHWKLPRRLMMDTPPAQTTSRRGFLKLGVLGIAYVATAGGAATLARGDADELAGLTAAADQIRPLDLGGIQAAKYVVGGTLVRPEPDKTYLIFDTRGGELSRLLPHTGKAVVRLRDCLAWNFRTKGDESLSAHDVNPSGLAKFQNYEVHNSTWVAKLVGGGPSSPSTSPDEKSFHHYIFTFGATSFECAVGKLEAHVDRRTFAEINKSLQSA